MVSFFRRKPRVLVLDDDASMQRLVAALMRHAGYTVDVVSGGAEALDRMERFDYRALLLDVMTPTQGAATVIRHLKEKQPHLLRRVVLVTASPDSLLKSFASDVFAVVRKPFDAAELTAVIGRVIAETDPPGRKR